MASGGIKRRAGVVAIVPDAAAMARLAGAARKERNGEWRAQRCWMSLETLGVLSHDPKASPGRIAAA